MAKQEKIDCIIIKGLNAKERLTRQLAENIARKSLTIFEQRDVIKKLITGKELPVSKGGRGITGRIREIARQLGCSR